MYSTFPLKKLFALTLMIFISSTAAIAQMITTDPAFPNVEAPLTITFDASDTALEGVSGNLYAHTGLITSEDDMNSGAWQHVIGNWGQNDVQPQFQSLGDDKWELEIPDIREFYGVPANEDVFQIAMVIRNSAGNAQTEDLFIHIFDELVSVRFVTPSVSGLNPFFTKEGEDVEITIAADTQNSDLKEIRLFINDDLVATEADSSELSFTYTVDTNGRVSLRAEAEDEEENTNETEIFIIVNPPISDASRPDGIEDGITYHTDDTKVTLSMFAPYKEFVYVIGDFNDWEVDTDYLMHRYEVNEDSVHFWIEIDGLESGKEYGFQYFVDGTIRMGDLFSEKVLDPWNDRWISNSVYPNLMPYPEGKTERVVSVLQTGQVPFEFSDFERPAVEDLVIYELLLRDFVEESTFTVLKDTLGYLERLGVTAVELMPVSNFDGNDSWGYNPNFHLALDKSYGTRRAFKEFVEAAHQRGMAVLLDVVYNHATNLSPLIELYGTNRDNNPYIGPGHAHNVFNHLNHDHPYIQYWMDRANRFWIEKYNVDGYRFDLTKGFANNDGVRNNVDSYNAPRVQNLRRMADVLWEFDPDAYIIIEHFQRQEEIELSTHRRDEGRQGVLSWNGMNHAYAEAAMGYTANLSNTYYPNAGFSVPTAITYMESHDEQWMMLKNRKFGNSSGSYDITDLDTALDRQKLVAAFFLTVPGPRMLWQFGELGYGGNRNECLKPGDGTDGDCEATDPGRTDRKPIRWDYYNDYNRQAVYQTWSWLLKLRNENEVFRSTDTEVSLNVAASGKRIVLEHESMDVVIIGNFGVTGRNVLARFTQAGTWYDYFSGESVEVSEDDLNIDYDLGPGTFKIFTTEQLETPPQGLVTSIEDEFADNSLPTQINLSQNYPNPFNPTTVISYQLPENSQVVLTVYDMLGRRVATLVDDQMSAGSHQVNFDASQLSSGMYIYRLEAGATQLTRKMMLVK